MKEMTTQEAISTLEPLLALFQKDAEEVRHRANTCATNYARDLWSRDAEKAEAKASALRLAVAALEGDICRKCQYNEGQCPGARNSPCPLTPEEDR